MRSYKTLGLNMLIKALKFKLREYNPVCDVELHTHIHRQLRAPPSLSKINMRVGFEIV